MKAIPPRKRLAVVLAGVTVLLAPKLAAATLVYDASTGSLPSAQGWIHHVNGLLESNYTLADGSLVQAPTGTLENRQYYGRSDVAFDFAADEVTASARLQIISSGLDHPPDPQGMGYRRAGWSMELTDAANRYVACYVGSAGFFLLGRNSESSGVVGFDTTSAFHDYELLANARGATLFVDGKAMASLEFDQLRLDAFWRASTMFIGDVTLAEASSSRLRSFSLDTVSTALSIRGTPVELGWDTRPRRTYQLEYRDTVNAAGWLPLGPVIPGDGQRVWIADPAFPGEPRRFYRLVITPVP